MINSSLTAKDTGMELMHEDGPTSKPILITETYGAINGTFDSVLLVGAGTYEIIPDRGLDGIVLTDIIVSMERKNLATVDIFLTDDVNDESIMLFTLTDAPVNMGMPLVGHWQGWQGTSLNVTLSLDATGCVAIGYYRVPEHQTLAYDAWIARR